MADMIEAEIRPFGEEFRPFIREDRAWIAAGAISGIRVQCQHLSSYYHRPTLLCFCHPETSSKGCADCQTTPQNGGLAQYGAFSAHKPDSLLHKFWARSCQPGPAHPVKGVRMPHAVHLDQIRCSSSPVISLADPMSPYGAASSQTKP